MRTYTVQTNAVSMASVVELAEIIGAAGKLCYVTRFKWGASDTTLVTAQSVNVQFTYFPATISNGTGGSSTTAEPTDVGDSAASVTTKTNNTSATTTNSTAVNLISTSEHIYNGIDLRFAMPGAEGSGLPPAIPVPPSTALGIELISTISGTCHADMTIWIAELG